MHGMQGRRRVEGRGGRGRGLRAQRGVGFGGRPPECAALAGLRRAARVASLLLFLPRGNSRRASVCLAKVIGSESLRVDLGYRVWGSVCCLTCATC